ncbi:MAG: hypothetical protein QG608_100 [Actinomycetota bacterium]|nr:hypothetical protein [Actinomycetota bacterium]
MKFRRPALLESTHRRENFDSGEPSLDDWLRRYAGQNRRRNTAAVWVITDIDDEVVTYATLSMSSVDVSRCPPGLAKGSPKQVPVLLVGRLATSLSVAGLGLGTQMIAHILSTTVELNEKAACRAVVVTALTKNASTWWQRFGFVPFAPDDPTDLDLYLLTRDITKTLSHQ